MILSKIETNFKSTGKNLELSIDYENIALVMEILINRMYENKEAAILRELICNGLDAGASKVDVTIKHLFENYYEVEVKDDGCGMDIYVIEKVYCSFANSTKRNTNEEIGGFGLGSKSPLSIAECIIVETVSKKDRTLFTMAIGENNIPTVSIMEYEKGDFQGKTGTSVKFTSKFSRDWQRHRVFNSKVFINGDQTSNENYIAQAENGDYLTINGGKGGRLNIERTSYEKSLPISIYYGNTVMYSIAPLELEDFELSYIDLYSEDSVVIPANIGDIDLIPSREYIAKTQKNKTFVLNYIKNLNEKIDKNIEENIKNCELSSLLNAYIYLSINRAYAKINCRNGRILSPSIFLSKIKNRLNYELDGELLKDFIKELKNTKSLVLEEAHPIIYNGGNPIEIEKFPPFKGMVFRLKERNKNENKELIKAVFSLKNHLDEAQLIYKDLVKSFSDSLKKFIQEEQKVEENVKSYTKPAPSNVRYYVSGCDTPYNDNFKTVTKLAEKIKTMYIEDFYSYKPFYLFFIDPAWEAYRRPEDEYPNEVAIITNKEAYKKLPKDFKITFNEYKEAARNKLNLISVITEYCLTYNGFATKYNSDTILTKVLSCFSQFTVKDLELVNQHLADDMRILASNNAIKNDKYLRLLEFELFEIINLIEKDKYSNMFSQNQRNRAFKRFSEFLKVPKHEIKYNLETLEKLSKFAMSSFEVDKPFIAEILKPLF